jgi:hypothetical protein
MKFPPTFSVTATAVLETPAPPSAVWQAYAAAPHWPRVLADLVQAWIEPDGRLEVGALIETRAVPESAAVNMRYRVIEAEPARRLRLASSGRGFRAETLYEFEPNGTGTRVRIASVFTPDTLVGGLIMRLYRSRAEAQLAASLVTRTQALLALAEEGATESKAQY